MKKHGETKIKEVYANTVRRRSTKDREKGKERESQWHMRSNSFDPWPGYLPINAEWNRLIYKSLQKPTNF